MLIDLYLPYYDATEVQELVVDAPPAVTYAAIRETDLADRMVNALFTIRELPDRIARKCRGEPPRGAVPTRFTFGNVLKSEMGWVLLAEDPDTEFVVGSVGRFWRADYGLTPVAPDRFIEFREPGYAKLAVSFRVEPIQDGKSLLRYEARTAATNETARRFFLRYWKLIHLGVAIVMRRALERIGEEAERRATQPNFGAIMRLTLIGLLLALSALPTQAQVPVPARPPGVTDSAIAWGKALFHGSANCSACHGISGRGTEYGPPITGALWLHGPGTYEWLIAQVKHGVPASRSATGDPMPMRGWSQMNDEDVKAVAAYVWSISHPPQPPPPSKHKVSGG